MVLVSYSIVSLRISLALFREFYMYILQKYNDILQGNYPGYLLCSLTV